MLRYLGRRLVTMMATLLAISALIFFIIQLPPGDYLSNYIAELQSQGEAVTGEKVEFLKKQYGLDRPLVEQYVVWVTSLLQGDLGYSFEHNLPVSKV
ncbi:MAG: ABC transporter permease, partial [Defluviicoccus sp.]|nr:ABC transporter permease [Defluviicoccus sp.]MDS4072677.1 ABC transporter permease [Defluviicoccus sp.]